MTKRLLSLLIALSMILSLVPAGFAADEGITIKYDFCADMERLGINYNSGNAIKAGTATGPLLDVIDYDTTAGFYDLVSASSVTPDQNFVYYLPGTLGLRQGRYVAFEINVPVAGKYKMLVDYSYRNKDVGIIHIYHAEGEYSASTYSPTGGTLVGGYDCYDANESSFFNKIRRGATVFKTAEQDANAFTSEAAELDIKIAGKHVITFYVPNGYRATVGSFSLVSGSGRVLMGARIGGLADKKATVTGIMSDGTEISDIASKGAVVTYESSDPNIVSIDSVTGEITEVGTGICNIMATVSYDGYTATAKSSYYVSDGGITVKYDVGGIMAKYDMKKGSAMHMSDVKYTHTDGFFQYAGASAIVNGTLWGAEYTTTAGIRTISMNNAGGWVSYKINVPKTGDYTLTMNHDVAKNGGYVDVYIDDVRVGSYSCYGTSANFFGGKNINSVAKTVKSDGTLGDTAVFNISEGEHTIKFQNRTNEVESGAVRGSSGTFTLISGDGSGAAIMSLELTGADKGKLYPQAKMSNGEVWTEFSGDEVTFKSSDEDIVKVDADGKITDIAAGEVTLSVTVKRKGEEKSATVQYTSLIKPAGMRTFYDFGGDMQDLGFTQGSGKLFSEIDYTITDGLYAPVGASYTGEAWEILKYKNKNLRIRDTAFIAIEVFVPERGLYDMEMWNAASDSALEIDVYVAKREELSGVDLTKLAGITPKSAYVGAYSCYDATVPYDPNDFNVLVTKPNIVENIRITEPGYYVFTFTATDRVEGENKNQIFGSVGSFGLVSGEEKYLLGATVPQDNEATEYYVAKVETSYLPYTDVNDPATVTADVCAYRTDGEEPVAVITNKKFRSRNDDVFTADANGLITAIGDGAGVISVSADISGKKSEGQLNLEAYDDTGVREVEWDVPETLFVREKAVTKLTAVMNSGNRITVPSETITFGSVPDGFVSIDELGMITGLLEGECEVTAQTEFRRKSIEVSAFVTTVLHTGKSEPTYYTYEKRENAQKNIAEYSWAKDIKKSAVASGDRYIGNYMQIYAGIYGEGIPRSRLASQYNDLKFNICRYCGADVEGKYGTGGSYGWTINALSRPWKIQCPDCKRLFPSNEFDKFFELGVDKQGYFDLEKAYEKHKELFAEEYAKSGYADQGYGYLKNVLYPEIGEKKEDGSLKVTSLNGGEGLRPGETVEGWGVDDSWGYLPKDENGNNYMGDAQNGIEERHAYIANYYYITRTDAVHAIDALANAYLYTGDEKYGRAGAILLDRFADVYPSFDFRLQNKDRYIFWGADGDSSLGKLVGHISDATHAETIANACDILYPMTRDSQVISFLSSEAERMGLENTKSSSEKIWNNWENGILLEIYRAAQERLIEGNFALGQTAVTAAAVALDREPETTEMIKWMYRTGSNGTGGNVLARIVNDVCRDGMGNETSENYNGMWINSVNGIADYLTAYKGSEKLALFEHPKFAKMFMPYMNKVSLNNQYANIGDNNETAELNFNVSLSTFVNGFKNLKNTVFAKDLAQFIYLRNGFSTNGLKYGIFDEDPEIIQDEIEALVEKNPEQKSAMMAGYGFAILRDGNNYSSASSATDVNNLRDFWMYFGKTDGHGHTDMLNIGVDAYGLNLSPDLGYPAMTGTDPERYQWVSATISHNTVVVDDVNSARALSNADPLHFDDSGYVKLIDVDAARYYSQTDIYRRTLVSVKVDDNISYGVDFFRVKGGNRHTFSFHGQAEDAYPVENIDFTTVRDENGRYLSGKQVDENGNYTGTYVHNTGPDGVTYYGIDVPYEDFTTGEWMTFTNEVQHDPWTQNLWFYDTYFPRGYTWLNKVRRDRFMENNRFAVEFDIKDYRKTIKDSKGIKLRLTQINDFVPDEVAFAGGRVPVKPQNAMMPATLDYMFVQRESKDGSPLDSMFMSVIEPYKGTRYIESIDEVSVEGDVPENGMVRAVKVTHTGGERTDYIVYATDNSKMYTVDGKFSFRGFVGVCSYNKAGAVIYRYVCDGDNITEDTETEDDKRKGAYYGTVMGFDKELTFGDFENWIDVDFDGEVSIDDIKGRWINIENDGTQNAAYHIEDAERIDEDTVRLHIGSTTLVRSFKDAKNNDAGYIYNIDKEQRFVIPSSFVENASPVFDAVSDKITTSAGSSVSVKVNAQSPKGLAMTYKAATLPRGASFNEQTATVTWKPDASQIGENHVAVTAYDSEGRESTVHFTITVYGSTTGSSQPDKTEDKKPGAEVETGQNPSNTPSDNSGTDAPTGGGGEGGGGASPTDKPENTQPDDGEDEEGNGEDTNEKDDTENAPEVSGETDSIRFADLTNHAWASDAINALAEGSVIRGTSATTFSPAANITRADFALLLVRAFGFASDNTENFADVNAGEYFAPELAIARNSGIVDGIGENKFAPRNSITRQDMMVIIYRAIEKLKVELGENTEPEYDDFVAVADYAKEAVSALIATGLVNGKSGRIAPSDYTTRAEVAVLIKRILDYTANK